MNAYGTPRGYIRTLTILHTSLMLIPFLGILFYFNASQNATVLFSPSETLYCVVILVALSCVLLENFISKNLSNKFPKDATLKQKLSRYQTASIVRYTLVEAGLFFCIFVFVASNDWIFLLISSIMILYFITMRPQKRRIEKSLKLNRLEMMQFNRLDETLL